MIFEWPLSPSTKNPRKIRSKIWGKLQDIIKKNLKKKKKNLVSKIFPPVILGPEMAAPILWAPGIFWFFLLENPHAHKIPPFGGGCWDFLDRGGWKCQFYFYGRGDF